MLFRSLLRRLIEVGRQENIEIINGYILQENAGMIRLAESMGFTMRPGDEDGVLEAELIL